MNILLIAANLLVYAWSSGILTPTALPRGQTLLPACGKYMLNPAAPQLYQFISYQFLHANLWHILGNMVFLYVFGNNLNEKLGHVGYLAFYLAGGVLAGFGHVLTSAAPVLGASGSISAIAGLFLALLPRTHIRIFVWFYVYVNVWEVPSMYFVLFNAGKDLLEQSMGGGGVAYMAHLSGTLAGALIGLLLLTTHMVQRDHYDLLAMFNRYRRRKTYESLVARGFEPFNPTAGGAVAAGSPSKPNASGVDPRVESLRAEISRLIRLHQLADATTHYLALRAIDASQVLADQEQVDVANQLMADGRYAEAAAAYEDYLRIYPLGVQRDQIALILGLICARYLPRHDRARELLEAVLPRLHNEQERQLAQAELQSLASGPPPAAGSGPSIHPA